MRNIINWAMLFSFLFVMQACSIKYSFSAGALDYSVYSTIAIADFPNNAELVNPTLSQRFSEDLRDKYTRQSKLSVIKSDGDLNLEGEIVGYNLQAMAIAADSYAAETKLTLTVNVRFSDAKNPENDFDDRRYSAHQMFDSNRMLADVEDELILVLLKEIIDQIFNDTVARW